MREERCNFATYHPINNFIYFLFVILATMFTVHPVFLGISLVAAIVYRIIWKGFVGLRSTLGILAFVVAITTIGNLCLSHNGVTVFFYANGNAVTLEALCYGLAMGAMIGTVIIWFMNAQEICTQDKFMYLFGRVAPSVALTISMMFRFIPLLQERYHKIHQAQYAMGRGQDKKLLPRMRQGTKEISILISWSLENSIDTADSMEARGYGLKHRTNFHLYRFTGRDMVNLGIACVAGSLTWYGIFSGSAEMYYYPEMIAAEHGVMTWITGVAYLLLLLLPMMIEIKGVLQWKQLTYSK